MAKRGLGIAQMPCALCEPDPDLYRLPAKYVEPGWGLWLLSYVDLRTTARVRIFKNFLLDELKRQAERLEGGCLIKGLKNLPDFLNFDACVVHNTAPPMKHIHR